MELEFEQAGDTLVAALHGELDHHSAADVRERIDMEIDRRGSRNLILSFGEMGFMDSAGIGVILGRYNKRKEAGGKLRLAGGSRSIRRILEMAGIYTILSHYETAEKAVEALVREAEQEAADGRKR